MKHLLLATALLTTPLAAEENHLFEVGGLEVLHPWTNATTHDHALLYMELHNEGDAPVEIISARTEDGVKGQLVGFRMADGAMVADPLPPIPVAPGTELALEPDVIAISFDGLPAPLEEGDHLEIILETSAGELEVEVAVEAADARQHSHAGHSH